MVKCKQFNCQNKTKKGHTFCGAHNGVKKTTTGFGLGYKPKPPCHSGQKAVITIGDIILYAGGRNRSGGWQMMNPPADLAMGPSETLGTWGKSKTQVPEGWSCEDVLRTNSPHMISFDWPDYSIPKVGKEFWYALIQDIKDNNIKRISTQCAGGHGRTGVQLAILAYLLSDEKKRKKEWPNSAVLVEWVRKAHCSHAVEARSQQEYIAEVCDIPLGEMLIAEARYSNFNYGNYSDDWVDVDDADDDKIQTLADAAEDEAAAMDDELIMDDEPESCPVCTGEVDDSLCTVCHTDLLNWEDDVKLHTNYCPLCDGDVPPAFMTEEGVCAMCHANTLGMDLRTTQEKINCTECDKFKPAYQFFTTQTDDTTCAQCYNGLSLSKKKRKPVKRKPKDVDELADAKYDASVGKKPKD
tara:strand:- start:964 stop:2196 length:1233 start_codon:yes stop_codon:yes gene_type:complete